MANRCYPSLIKRKRPGSGSSMSRLPSLRMSYRQPSHEVGNVHPRFGQATRSAAFDSLCDIGGESARVVDAVVRLVEREDGGGGMFFDRYEVRRLIQKVTGPGAEDLAAVIKNGDPELVSQILSLFRNSGSLQSDPVVMEAIRSRELQDR